MKFFELHYWKIWGTIEVYTKNSWDFQYINFNNAITSNSFLWNFSNYFSKIILLLKNRRHNGKFSINVPVAFVFSFFQKESLRISFSKFFKLCHWKIEVWKFLGFLIDDSIPFVSPFDKSRRILPFLARTKVKKKREIGRWNFSTFNSNNRKVFEIFNVALNKQVTFSVKIRKKTH